MPSSIGHAAVAVLLQPMLPRPARSAQALTMAAVAVAALDIDAAGRPFGLGDLALVGGHRALTHAPVFALLLAGLLTALVVRRLKDRAAAQLYAYLSAVLLSHGVLDAMSAYGAGVTFGAPFSWDRWRLVWRPFSGILPEVLLLWLPAGIYLAISRPRVMRAAASDTYEA